MKAAKNLLAGATLAALAATAPTALSATTYSSVLGYYTIDAPAGNSIWASGLVRKKLHQGDIEATVATTVGGEAATTITESDRDLSGISEANGYTRHYVEILEIGATQGLILDIIPNSATANSIQVEGDISSIAAGANFCIREHVTLGDLFPAGSGFSGFQDSLRLFFEGGTSESYSYVEFASNAWANAQFGSADDQIIYPGQGFIINLQSAASILVGKNGISYVKETPTIVPLYAGTVNLVGLVNPLVGDDPNATGTTNTEALGDLGLKNSLTAFADSVSVRLDDGSLSSVGNFAVVNFGGGNSFFDSDVSDPDAVPIPVGGGVIVNVGEDTAYTQPVLHPTAQ